MEITCGITQSDNKLENIQVHLYEKNGNQKSKIETTTTNANGEYKFNRKLLSQFVKEGRYIVEFDYSNYSKIAKTQEEYNNSDKYLYMPVQPNIGIIQGSKAITEETLPKEDKEIINNNLYKAVTGYRRKCIR